MEKGTKTETNMGKENHLFVCLLKRIKNQKKKEIKKHELFPHFVAKKKRLKERKLMDQRKWKKNISLSSSISKKK